MKETRIHPSDISEAKGLGPLSSFSFLVKPTAQIALKSSNGNQLTDDEQKLLAQINPKKHKLFSHTHLEFRGQQTTEFQ